MDKFKYHAGLIFDKAGKQVATVFGTQDAERIGKLMAAAPALLEALVIARNRLIGLHSYFTAPNFTDRYGDAEINAACLEKISAALAAIQEEEKA